MMNIIALGEQEKHILNKIHAGVLYCKNDAGSTILYANDYFYSIVGYTREEISTLFQDKFASLVISDVSKILVKVARAIQENVPLDYEFQMRHKDGRILHIHDTAHYDAENNCWYVTIMDVSAMKSIEYERNKLSLYLHHVPDKIIISDSDGQILFKNNPALLPDHFDPKCTNLFEMIEPLVHPDDLYAMRQKLEKEEIFEYETQLQKNGRYVNHDRNRIIPIHDPKTNALHYMHVSMDLLPQGDVLTSFPSRTMFEQYYNKVVEHAPHAPLHLGILDVDNFKCINDTYGHHTGDLILKRTARQLATVLSERDYLCRFGGDEFLILLVDYTDKEVKEVLSRIRALTFAPVHLDGYDIQISYSIGVAFNYNRPVEYLQLNKQADEALYTVKKNNKGSLLIV